MKIDLCIFSSRESISVLHKTISNALYNLQDTHYDFLINVLINGNPTLYNSIRNLFRDSRVNFHYLEIADKASAWNYHIHNLASEQRHSIYIDGYVLINSASVVAMLNNVVENCLLGTTGVPSSIFSMTRLQPEKAKFGFHGNCCVISRSAIEKFQNRNIRIPIYMYRVDGFVGAVLSFGFNQFENDWLPECFCPVTLNATWKVQRNYLNIFKEIKVRVNRKKNQAKGEFENAAITFALLKLNCSFEKLPSDIYSLIRMFRNDCPEEYEKIKNKSDLHKKCSDSIESAFL